MCENAAARKWMSENKERRKKYRREYYKINKDRELAKMKEWASDNREQSNNIKKQYKLRNPDEVAKHDLRRKRISKVQTPELDDYDKDKLKQLYKLSSSMGETYHVDHIVPLSLGGLHHPDNLQIIEKKENLCKHNNPNYKVKGLKIYWKNDILVGEV
jgi:5-methylcytosine-specific restriction endonuclease McrA